MKHVFNRLSTDDEGSALVDWTVLLAGIAFLAISVAPAVADLAKKNSGAALDHAELAEDWLPS